MLEIIIFSAAAGILGMGIGGLIPAVLLKKPSEITVGRLLSFAAGVMISIVCFGLITETLELAGTAVCVIGLTLGVFIITVLNRVIDRITDTKKVHYTHEELYLKEIPSAENAKMRRSGVIMLIAIGIHNIPEGIALGAGGSHDFRLGVILAVLITAHNIPVGMAVTSPLFAGGMNRIKAVLLTSLCGAATLLGGITGIFIGEISDIATAFSLSAAAGGMLYIVFGEMIPRENVAVKSRASTMLTLLGIAIGLAATQIQI